MKKIFEITLFKKIFLIILVCITVVEGFHVYLDYNSMVIASASELAIPGVIQKMELIQTEYYKKDDEDYEKVIKLFNEEFSDFYGYNAVVAENKEIIQEYNSFDIVDRDVSMRLEDESGISARIKGFEKQQIKQFDEYISQAYYNDRFKPIKVKINEDEDYEYDENIQPKYLEMGGTVYINEKGDYPIKEYTLMEYRSSKYFYTKYREENKVVFIDFDHMYQVYKKIIKDYGTMFKTIENTQMYYLKEGDNLFVRVNWTIVGNKEPIELTHVYFSPNCLNDILEQTIILKQPVYITAFILTVGISFLISYMLTRRIKKIDKITELIANNDFDQILKEKPKDELGKLSISINKMSLQLKNTIEQLNTEIEKVKELESLRKDFVNQFTHEMKTPLGIINGYSELIEEAENQEEVDKYLDIINRETTKINELIQSMLKLSRLEAGKVELNKELFDLEESIVHIVDDYEILLMKKNIKVEVHNKNSEIVADKKLIETVIHNFLSNAIKHTLDNHRIMITIDNGVAIYNEGDAIKEDHIDHIWHTFVTHDQKGSGLGLAISRSILELHQFSYGVENQDNGVCFYFNINYKSLVQ